MRNGNFKKTKLSASVRSAAAGKQLLRAFVEVRRGNKRTAAQYMVAAFSNPAIDHLMDGVAVCVSNLESADDNMEMADFLADEPVTAPTMDSFPDVEDYLPEEGDTVDEMDSLEDLLPEDGFEEDEGMDDSGMEDMLPEDEMGDEMEDTTSIPEAAGVMTSSRNKARVPYSVASALNLTKKKLKY